ncbi:MAG: peroxiredoxin [Rhodospirillaceae bacterium TMED8]|nr:peroxiredoxin [Magnetovibrio sp.]OUT48152.1 MAG: peroxiredoxin [Rhodospirillaceae bacterium TMED8]
MTISRGDNIPSVTLTIMGSEGPEGLSTDSLFNGKKVAIFGVPGAFTPTCSAKHLPGFVQHASAIKAKGVDTIACISVNDVFVMGAWGQDQNVGDNVLMVADGSAKFAEAVGLILDLSERGLGIRCQRFAMLVDDGIVQSIHIDEGTFEKTSAEQMLSELT